MKAAGGTLATHITQPFTRLAMIWQMTRTDGTVFRFTDHDRDIVYEGNTYSAASGFSRSNIVSKHDMSPDNLELRGVVLSGFITEDDVRRGLYDFAEIEIKLVRWDTLTSGEEIKLRKGTIGNVDLESKGFKAEMRGMTQLFVRKFGDMYTADCRADLGDARCGFDLSTVTETSEIDSITSNVEIVVPEFFERNFDSDVDAASGDNHKILVDPVTGDLTMLPDGPEDGSPLRPFEIANFTDLEAIASGTHFHYRQTADIDMSARPLWVKVDIDGLYDGQGYKISDMDMDNSGSPVNTALFGNVFGTVRRVHLDNPVIEGGAASYSCGIAVTADGTDGEGIIEDCIVSTDADGNAGAIIESAATSGAIVGIVDNGGIVRRCHATVYYPDHEFSVTATGTEEEIHIDEGGGNEITTMALGDYTPFALAAEITTKLNANGNLAGTYLCSVDTTQRIFTLARTDGTPPTNITVADTDLSDNINLTSAAPLTGDFTYTGTEVDLSLAVDVGGCVGLLTSGTVSDCVFDKEIAGFSQIGDNVTTAMVTAQTTTEYQDADDSDNANFDQANDYVYPGGANPRFMDPGRCN